MDKLLKLDLGCGPSKEVGFTGVDVLPFDGVDVVTDLRKTPWPWEDKSVDQVFTSHFVEHLEGSERIDFFNELYRVMAPGGKAEVIVPHWSNACAYGDPTHKWPPMSEWFFLYLDRDWRKDNGPHVGYTCDFKSSVGFASDDKIEKWDLEKKSFAITHYINSARDMRAVLTRV